MKRLIILTLVFITGCNSVPTSLDGEIVTRADGTTMKIKWGEGNGNKFNFYMPVLVTTELGDTTTEWRRINK
jgi:hypothetical protein